MKMSVVQVVFIALRYYQSGYSQYSSPTRSTHFPFVVLVYLLVVLVCPLVVLVYPFVCLLVVLVYPFVVSVCPLVVLSTIYKAESTSKIELLLRRVESRVAELVIVSSNHILLNGIKTRVAESNFLHFLFVSSNRVWFGGFVFMSTVFASANQKFPFLLPFWCCFF